MSKKYSTDEEAFLTRLQGTKITRNCWKAIREQFNSIFGTNRTIEGLRSKYYSMRRESNRNVNNDSNEDSLLDTATLANIFETDDFWLDSMLLFPDIDFPPSCAWG
ncbi:hypothetical protein BDZ91DRAFT_729618 [Kalaharituber pfeilii]|nr:hypothetical protein BDZ91DRAFT_729618 [Kalaharituber pfeilii]